MNKRVAVALAAVVVVVFLVVMVFPTRGILDQRAESAQRNRELAVQMETKRKLEAEVKALQSREVIEKKAREQNMTKPGEIAFGVLPATPKPVELPEVWPFKGAADWINR